MASTLPLFVYGTLRDADIVSLVLGRTVAIDTLPEATAPDYVAVPYPDRTYPALTQKIGASAPGRLLVNLSRADLARLDAFEGEEYHRDTISVLSGGQTLLALCYLPTRPVNADALPWSLADWHSRHKPAMLAAERSRRIVGSGL